MGVGRLLCEETGRRREAREFGRQAKRMAREGDPMTVRRTVELDDGLGDGAVAVKDSVTGTFDGPPLERLEEIVQALQRSASGRPAAVAKVGRNAPCPCGSGRKFKRCCGSGQPA